jgi:hypothetical protein
MVAKKPKRTKKDGPYLAAAFFCENAIADKADGALIGFRIIDTLNISLPADPSFPSEEKPLAVQIAGILSFRTGDSPGQHVLRVVMTSPTGKKNPPIEQTLTFTSPEQGGANLVLRNNIRVIKGGVFWFDIFLDGKRFTRMPLRITLQRADPPTPANTDGQNSA